jgi:hypothetical protein
MTKLKGAFAWRPLLRAVHRDMGYVVVGLTLIYALSGLAVNHIADWDPNFKSYETAHELGPLEGEPEAIAATVRAKLGIAASPREVYAASPDDVEVLFDRRTLHVNPLTGHVVDEGQKPRFLLRVANWLHLNRGKKAWRYIADAYAAVLLFLSVSGMFMIKGPKGLVGRGAILVAAGIAIPVLYVTLAGGP